MRPPFAYYGGKTGLARRIVALMPEHRVYIEPFFGSGAVLFAKPPSPFEIVNDVDDSVVTFFRVLRDRPEDLGRVCALTPHARAEYSAADLDEDLDDLERARRFWVRVNQSFAKTAGDQTGWSVTTARTQAVPASITSRIARFHEVAGRLHQVTIEHCDAAALVERLATPDTVVYADPPYLHSTRAARQDRQRPKDYRHDMGAPEDHERLAGVLRATPATVLLSGYRSDLYDRLFDGWDRLDIEVTAHSSNSRRGSRSARVESIWSNRPLDVHGRLFEIGAPA